MLIPIVYSLLVAACAMIIGYIVYDTVSYSITLHKLIEKQLVEANIATIKENKVYIKDNYGVLE